MSFDLFVQSCIILKRMTDVFKKYDDDRDGYITLSFEEFLTGGFFLLSVVLAPSVPRGREWNFRGSRDELTNFSLILEILRQR